MLHPTLSVPDDLDIHANGTTCTTFHLPSHQQDEASGVWEYQGAERSLDFLHHHLLSHGPYDGLMGFSQGASLAATVVALQERGQAFQVGRGSEWDMMHPLGHIHFVGQAAKSVGQAARMPAWQLSCNCATHHVPFGAFHVLTESCCALLSRQFHHCGLIISIGGFDVRVSRLV